MYSGLMEASTFVDKIKGQSVSKYPTATRSKETLQRILREGDEVHTWLRPIMMEADALFEHHRDVGLTIYQKKMSKCEDG